LHLATVVPVRRLEKHFFFTFGNFLRRKNASSPAVKCFARPLCSVTRPWRVTAVYLHYGSDADPPGRKMSGCNCAH
jgi:hypothetical protein